MAILGVENAIYGVDDLALNTKFWEDFGLVPVSTSDTESVFEVASGSRVTVMHRDDPRLPDAYAHTQGVRETIWGVDTQASLDELVADLSSDRDVTFDDDGTAHFLADDGMPLGLKVWNKREVISSPDPVNAPGNIQRLNLHRKWRMRARPKTINHIVFFSNDYVSSFEFFRDRLGFRLTDHSKGVGIFARADGTYEHHSIFWVNTALPVAPDKPGFMHMAFGVEDIDEIMLGANLMADKGWENTTANTSGGLSRHRISSALYYYCECPGGGEAEYHADTDYVDDNWIPRAWDWKFGSLLWAHKVPEFFRAANPSMEMVLDPEGLSLEEYRGLNDQLDGADKASNQ